MEVFFDEALATYESRLLQSVDTVIFGRATYQGFVSYWPQVPSDPASPQRLVEYAQRLNTLRKIVFSRTLSHVTWNNTTLVKEVVPADILRMKQESGLDMLIYGSASLVQTLTNLRLIDRYQLLIYPTAIGSGKPLFRDIAPQVKFSLIGTETHPSGVVVLSYQPKEEKPSVS
jgi:dihydrofolate reductase